MKIAHNQSFVSHDEQKQWHDLFDSFHKMSEQDCKTCHKLRLEEQSMIVPKLQNTGDHTKDQQSKLIFNKITSEKRKKDEELKKHLNDLTTPSHANTTAMKWWTAPMLQFVDFDKEAKLEFERKQQTEWKKNDKDDDEEGSDMMREGVKRKRSGQEQSIPITVGTVVAVRIDGDDSQPYCLAIITKVIENFREYDYEWMTAKRAIETTKVLVKDTKSWVWFRTKSAKKDDDFLCFDNFYAWRPYDHSFTKQGKIIAQFLRDIEFAYEKVQLHLPRSEQQQLQQQQVTSDNTDQRKIIGTRVKGRGRRRGQSDATRGKAPAKPFVNESDVDPDDLPLSLLLTSGIRSEGKDTDNQESDEDNPLEETMDESKDCFEVEQILAHRGADVNRRDYLIKWKGWSSEFNTWEPRINITSAKNVLYDYDNQNNLSNKKLKT
jgi:hypothetical protein